MNERERGSHRGSDAFSFHSVMGRCATLVAIALLGVTSIAWLGHARGKEIQVTGPLYHRIVQDKDLIADVLPPPEYIIETYLLAHEMLRETHDVALQVLFERAKSLRSDFDNRHEYWAKELDQDGVRQALIETSFEPARQFFTVFDAEFIPAVRSQQLDTAAKILDEKLTPLYAQHRTAIDQVVALATARSAQTEASTPGAIAWNTNLTIAFAIAMFVILAVMGWFFTQAILQPFNETVAVLECVATGDLSRTAAPSRLDEVRRLGDALNGSLLGMRDALGSEKVDWAELGRQRAEVGRIRQLLHNAPLNILYAERDLTLSYMNPAAGNTLRLLGAHLPLTVDQMIGRPVEFFGDDSAAMRQLLSDPKRLPYRAQLTLGPETVDFLASGIRDENGQHLGVMITLDIVTTKLAAEQTAKDAQARELALLGERRLAEQADAERRQRETNERMEEQRQKADAEYAQAQALRRRVDEILEVVSAAGRGDLKQQVRVDGSDAVAHLGDGLNGFFANLSRSISDIAKTAENVASSSTQMNEVGLRLGETASSAAIQADAVATAAAEVASNVQTVAAATEEMSASIREIARNASEAAHVANQAVQVAGRTNAAVSKLGDSSAEIGKVIKVITSIAEQTNLLALNATIEAARAGEAGKGFAVVANEVKELAKETARATEEIGATIEAIQADTEDAVAAIRKISEIILQISDTQTTIAAAVEEQTATTKDMSRNVSEAARGVKEIAENIQGVAHTAKAATDGARQSQTAAGDLARAAMDLQALVAQFQVSDRSYTHSTPHRSQVPSLRMVVPRRGT